ncbi:hypothetical protein FKM82_030774, partial [Ascaphus truei]
QKRVAPTLAWTKKKKTIGSQWGLLCTRSCDWLSLQASSAWQRLTGCASSCTCVCFPGRQGAGPASPARVDVFPGPAERGSRLSSSLRPGASGRGTRPHREVRSDPSKSGGAG